MILGHATGQKFDLYRAFFEGDVRARESGMMRIQGLSASPSQDHDVGNEAEPKFLVVKQHYPGESRLILKRGSRAHQPKVDRRVALGPPAYS